MKKWVFHICILISASTLIIAQEYDIAFDYFDISNSSLPFTDNGFLITGAVQDKNGFIWLSSRDGMVGYDGQSVFSFAEEVTNQIIPHTTFYHQSKIDTHDNIWLMDRMEGTIFINKAGTKATKFETPEIIKSKKAHFADVIFNGDSIAWFSSTDMGIHRFRIHDSTWNHYYPPMDPTIQPEGNTGFMIRDPFVTEGFLLSSRYGIHAFNYSEKKWRLFNLETPITKHRAAYLYPIFVRDNEIYLGGIFNRGIEYLNYNEGKWAKKPIDISSIGSPQGCVLSFYPLDENRTLLGLYSNSKVGLLDHSAEGIKRFTTYDVPNDVYSSRFDHQIIKGKNGSVHLVNQKGITRLIDKKKIFNYYRLTLPDSKQNNWQRSFLQLSNPNKFLLGTYFGDGLAVVDWEKKSHKFISFKGSKDYFDYDPLMWSLAAQTDTTIWIGTDDGVLKANLSNEYIYPAEEFIDHPILSTAEIRFLFTEPNKLWISTLAEGVFQLDRTTQAVKRINLSKEVNINQIIHFQNRLLLATDKGVLVWDPIHQKEIIDSTFSKLPIHVTDLFKLGDSVWIATKNKGLYNAKAQNGDFLKQTHFSNPEAPSLNLLHKIVCVEEKNELIMNAGSGYSVFHLDDHTFINYLVSDGIGFAVKNVSIFERLSDGTIINGANRNFQYFRPMNMEKKVSKPTPYIKQILADGELLRNYDTNNEPLHLKPGTENISFQIGAVNYNPEPQNYFSYRLKGVNDQWTKWSNNDYVNFSNLKGGTYAFEYKAANKLFEANEPVVIPIEIHKKRSETNLFKILFSLGIFGIAYSIFWFWNKQKRRELQLKEEYQTQINELQMNALQLQMNPHFVFNSINSINYYIIKNDRDKASNYLAKFSRLIRLILENSKEKLVSLEQEIEAIRLYLEIEQIRFEEKFEFEIEVDQSVHLSSTQIPPLILQPFIENAIWHGLMHKNKVGHLLIKVQDFGDEVKCMIEDDGIGRAASAKLNTGKGFKKQSLGTKITNNRLAYVEKIYGLKTSVTTEDLIHMDGTAAGTRVTIYVPKLKKQ